MRSHMVYLMALLWAAPCAQTALSGTLSGRVADQDGAPVAKAAVLWWSVPNVQHTSPMALTQAAAPAAVLSGSVVSDANGLFQTGTLPQGSYRLCVTSVAQPSHLSTCEWRAGQVALSISDTAAAVNLVVQSGTVLRFHFSDAGGRLTSDNLSVIVSAATGGFAHARVSSMTPTDALLSVSVPFNSEIAVMLSAPAAVEDNTGAQVPLGRPAIAMTISTEAQRDIWLTAK
jgi:hypothetical protein